MVIERLIENCVVFMVMSTQVNTSVRIGLLVFVPEIPMLKFAQISVFMSIWMFKKKYTQASI